MKIAGVDFSPYSLRARLRPVLFVALPVGLGVAAWFPADVQGWGWLLGVAATCGLTFFFAETTADVGREKQKTLWKLWGGAPTTIQLRHRTSSLNPLTLARYHAKLQQLRPELHVPNREEEEGDAAGADHVYESCVDFLREATRDTAAFPMVFSDNVNYGYRRNLWAVKPWGLALCVLGAMACGARVVQLCWMKQAGVAVAVACGVACLVLLAAWGTVVRPAWVRRAGDAYALRLLAALDKL